MALSEEDDAVLSTLGQIISINYVQFGLEYTFYGVYLVLFPVSFIVLWRKRVHSLSTRCLILATSLLFISSTMRFVSNFIIALHQIKADLITTGRPLDQRRLVAAHEGVYFVTAQQWAQPLNFMIGDSIVIWRAWILFPRSRLVRIILAVFGLANITVSIYFACLMTAHQLAQSMDFRVDIGSRAGSIFVSFATNLVGTSLIISVAWKHRMRMREISSGYRIRTKAEKSLLLLAETGIVFCAIQLVYGAVLITTKRFTMQDSVERVLSGISVYGGAIYPTLIIIIGNLQKYSIIETATLAANSNLNNEHHRTTVQEDVFRLSRLRSAPTEVKSVHSHGYLNEGIGEDGKYTVAV